MNITTLGEARFPSPLRRTSATRRACLPASSSTPTRRKRRNSCSSSPARAPKLFFDPQQTRAGIVTCGGLCPGLNNVIRSLFLELHHGYGVKEVLGFRDGYQGLDPARGAEPLVLTPEFVDDIHKEGGTVLGTSRGPVDVGVAVDNLIRRGVNILFTIGGDGTQRGGNDCSRKPGSAATRSRWSASPRPSTTTWPSSRAPSATSPPSRKRPRCCDCAHTEAHSVAQRHRAGEADGPPRRLHRRRRHGRQPGRELHADPGGALPARRRARLPRRARSSASSSGRTPSSSWPRAPARICWRPSGEERDASGNVKLQDIGLFLRERIESYFKAERIPVALRYFDPSYLIRSVPGQRRGLDPLRPLRPQRRPRRDGRQDRPGDRPPARRLHPRAHRTAGQPEEAPGPGRRWLARRAGLDRPEVRRGYRRGLRTPMPLADPTPPSSTIPGSAANSPPAPPDRHRSRTGSICWCKPAACCSSTAPMLAAWRPACGKWKRAWASTGSMPWSCRRRSCSPPPARRPTIPGWRACPSSGST